MSGWERLTRRQRIARVRRLVYVLRISAAYMAGAASALRPLWRTAWRGPR